jgi:hypothetical protein
MYLRFRKVSAGAAFLAIAAAAITIASRRSEAANDNNSAQDEKLKIQIGATIVPVQLKLTGKDPDVVFLGSYIVNTAGCNDCHTNPSYIGNPFLGDAIQFNGTVYMGGGRSFGPGVFSRNITPDATGKPAGMSFPDFELAMRTGKDVDNIHPLLQTMPWPRFRSLTDRDMQAIYQYLSTIPCLEGDPGVDPTPPLRCSQ